MRLGRKRRGDPPSITLRGSLLANLPLEKVASDDQGPSTSSRWLSLFAAAHQAVIGGDRGAAVQHLRQIIQTNGLDTRIYLQAWHCLRALGEPAPPDKARVIHGVVVEYHLNEGLDVVAAYSDHSARYFNHSGAGVVWDAPGDAEVDQLVDGLLQAGQIIVDHSGPWEGAYPPIPAKGRARINLLTFGGVHFGEGTLDQMSNDPVAGTLLNAAVALMQALIGKHQAQG